MRSIDCAPVSQMRSAWSDIALGPCRTQHHPEHLGQCPANPCMNQPTLSLMVAPDLQEQRGPRYALALAGDDGNIKSLCF